MSGQGVKRFGGVAIAAACLSVGFGAGMIWPKAAPSEKVQISLSADALALQISDRAALTGREQTKDEIDALTARQVAYEVMVREAADLNVHLNDADIRKHMVAVMQHIMSTIIREPTDAEIAEFLAENPDRYKTPRKFTFEHIFFANNPEAAEEIHRVLLAGGEVPPEAGDVFWLGTRMEQYSGNQLLTLLGHKFVRAVSEMPSGQWSRPIPSARGLHIVKLERVHAPIPLPPEEMEARLRADWKKRHQAEVFDSEIERRSARYDITLPDAETVGAALVRHDEKTKSKWASTDLAEGQ